MRVIGTAGHVDHGKTRLIQALTGMDADRLPEEKARGMTTDLGFAWYEGSDGQAIGVVDVPGHERYLRNMVAGAWGLDLALLVIAADDGWMPQTGLHASILSSLGVPGLVVALNKADLVEPQRLADLRVELETRTRDIFGSAPPIIPVSALEGTGLLELKEAIEEVLSDLPKDEGRHAYLYIDRAFAPRAGGTVVTGTLRGGSIAPGDRLTLLPAGEELKVKGVQTYRHDTGKADPGSRTALALPAAKGGYVRGDLLSAPGAFMLNGLEFLCKFLPLPGGDTLYTEDSRGRPLVRSGVEAELAVGSAKRDARIWPIKDSGFARVVCGEALACPPGFPFALLRKGGAELIGRGLALGTELPGPEKRRGLDVLLLQAQAAATALEALGWGSIHAEALRFCVRVYLDNFAPLPPGLGRDLAESAGLVVAGEYAFRIERWDELGAALIKLAGKPGGVSRAEAQSAMKLPSAAADDVLGELESRTDLRRDGPVWRLPGREPALTHAQAELARRLEAAADQGLEPGKTTDTADATQLKALCSLGKAVPLEGGIYISRSVYEELARAVLRDRKLGDRFSVPDAKARTGLSRKYILPLLNKMEGQGFVKRWNDERVVVRIL